MDLNINNISEPNIFSKDIKLFNRTKPKINLNPTNQEKNALNINSLNLFDNINIDVNESKNNINTNSSTNKNLFSTRKIDTINDTKQLNNSFNIPVFPPFLIKEDIKKNNLFMNNEKSENKNINGNVMNMNSNINNNLNYSMNYPINNNIYMNPVTNSVNKINYIMNCKKPLIISNPNNNFMNDFALTMNKLLFPGITQLSLNSPMNNNYLSYQINSLNNNKSLSINLPENINNNNHNGNINQI